MASQAAFVTKGYGQVEPNHLSAQRTGQIYAQLPANKNINILENGQFVKYDYLNGEVNFTGKGEWMLVYNEVKVYRDREVDSDFAMIKENYHFEVYDAANHNFYDKTTQSYTKSLMVPRVFKTNIGDIMTTNMIKDAKANIAAGDLLQVGTDGILKEVASATADMSLMTWQVAAIRTMPDGQVGAKLIRVA